MGRRKKSTPKKVATKKSRAKHVVQNKSRECTKSHANAGSSTNIQKADEDQTATTLTIIECKNKWWTQRFDESKGDASKIIEYS